MPKLQEIIKNQKDFQRLVDFPVDSILENDRNEMSEKYIFKLIEEAIEVRREFPSVMNPWSKSNKPANIENLHRELSDVFLFFINILNVWRIDFDTFLDVVSSVQENNFIKIRGKMLDRLNSEMLAIPGYTVGLGQGSLKPKYLFVGQNPGDTITHGYKVWSDPGDGSSKILIPILENLGILNDCYFTNLVKCTTLNNTEPTDDLVNYWLPFYNEERKILQNPDMKVIALGRFVQSKITHNEGIYHPAYLLRNNNVTISDYEKQIRKAVGLDN